MFEALSEKLNRTFRVLGDKGRLTEKDIDAALRDVRMALLEADVNFKVVRNFVASIRDRAVNEDVLKSLTPGQQVVKIANEVLTDILGGGRGTIGLKAGSNPLSTILMVGLNGSGKTTTAAKLARYLKQSGQQPLMIAADLLRPAAINQLESLGGQINVPVYRGGTKEDTCAVALRGIKQAEATNASWAIVDTAGRFQVDDDLMKELEAVKRSVDPEETILVVDAMTGQDAVNVANEFHGRIGLTGLILTKLDGDARGGAALSVVSVTGVPIKFIGIGEKLDALEEFHPDRLASRILGMGDMLTLIEKAEQTFGQEESLNLQKKIRESTFDLDDFLGQLQQLRNMGSLSQIMEMIPGMSSMKGRIPTEDLDDSHISKIEAIIYSMTIPERRTPGIISGSRRRRIARGSGTKPQDVNQLLNQFRQTQKLMKQMSSGKGIKDIGRIFR